MEGALMAFIGTVIAMTIVAIFSKSNSKKISQSKERILTKEKPNIEEIVALLIGMEDEDDEEKLKYINLIEIDTVELTAEHVDVDNKFYLFYIKSIILMGKNSFTEAKPLIENLIRFLDFKDGDFESYSDQRASVIFLQYSIIKYIEGNDNDSERYHTLANKYYGEVLELDFQQYNEFRT